jgi:hypothetical protein
MKYVAQITVFVEITSDDEADASTVAEEFCESIMGIDHDELVSAQVYKIRDEDETGGHDDEEDSPEPSPVCPDLTGATT